MKLNWNQIGIIVLFFSLLLFIAGCKSEVKSLTYKSPEEKVEIIFTAARSSSLDPWMVSINIKGYGHDETVATEIYNSTIDNSVIQVNWENENSATLLLKQRDGENKSMTLSISKDLVDLR